MKNTVSITVVIPCYNCVDTIGRAVTSVLEQTVLPEQIILIDDRSTDQTYDVITAISLAHSSVKVLQNPVNGGASVARNYGWSEVATKYVAFLDADDCWHPKKIEVQFNLMEQIPNVAFSGHLVSVMTQVQRTASELSEKKGIELIGARKLLLRNCFATSSVMLKKDLPVRFDAEKRRSEDYLLWLTLLFSGFEAALIHQPLGSRFAAPFGEAGLSGNLLSMQAAELETLKRLRKQKYISAIELSLAVTFSCLKLLRRIAVSGIRNRFRKFYA
ncbi:glycosyltransferase family 2 protein [Massilia sp. Dwa41.01b]|uniref:glycosyltransferase family 2 protein n=1 Tax=unclassified Massilia TaxID=2609279 RepID=UPI001602945A|nr:MULTISPECIES: glycosyltransferase family 2 protein [unclassified Massilia]QNA89672.1 glycosyltransferase family 2 protein [Massilia sp. Dwa41.01b]QNB00567.1 glycosyltransferase family 2 protein [Massilia sp. Se16.2.3]